MKKISIIVPCYNVERYLDRCLNSIVNQTLRDIQIILVDDLSPDNVPIMCDEWKKKDDRIIVIHKEKNEGLGFARNTGLQHATGEFVAFIDSDDFVELKMFETLYETAKENHSDVVLCNMCFYNKTGKTKKRYDVRQKTSFVGRSNVDQFLLNMVAPLPEESKDVKYMMSVWHGIYNREIITSNNITFLSEREFVSEDLLFDICLFPCVNNVIFIPDCFYFYCINENSLTHTYSKDKYEKMKTFLDKTKSMLSSIYEEEKYLLHFERLCFLYLRIYLRHADNNVFSVKEIVNDKYWEPLLNNYPYHRMQVKHRIFFYILKNRFHT